jgi:NAD-dependent deacetylase
MKYGEAEKRIIIFSGAGLDAPSGIKTFRDSNGLWNDHDIDEVCNENTWKNNFELVHQFYNERRTHLAEVKPNKAHHVIKSINDKYGSENVYNVTMNVSDLLEQAGVESLHVHGNLTKLKCEACGNAWDIGYSEFNTKEDRCPKCDSLKGVRPDIVFFYGQAPEYMNMYKAFDYTMHKDTIAIVIGTMGNVVHVNGLLQGTPCKKILCNMEESEYINESMFDKVYYESIETAIDKIEKDIDEMWNS